MKCPYCSYHNSNVVDSRECESNSVVRRRRECEQCQKRWTTYEKVQGVDLFVIKKSGEKQKFERSKLKRGIIKATWKRPVTLEDIENIIQTVEQKLRRKESTEIKSWEIGNLVINQLKRIDPLSYLLFASVYRDFESLEDFEKEIQKLHNN